ncbi:MAG: SUMF1/EgtB/PvdO family nonheme iron enzyme [Alphaproteobacteria bacterium]|nr:SUMF1/EgtB/PvdO family nonheme iron enzyme [Alphaproteobacteria bacterium]
MNQFEEGLRRARRSQVRFYVGGLVALLLIGLALLGVLVSTNGTVVEIKSDAAASEGEVDLVGGFGVVVNTTIYSAGGTPTIRVHSEGFREVVRDIQPDELGRRIEVALEPLPGRLEAATTRDLPETRWSIDGKLVATTTAIDVEFEAGPYALNVNHPHFQIVDQDIELQRGKTEEIRLDLVPVQGRLTIASQPSGAEVELDGRSLGVTPLGMALAGGSYLLRVSAPDRISVEEAVEVTHTTPAIVRNFNLRPVSSTLKIVTVPSGGQLLVDGRRVPASGEIELTANEDHNITYVRDGYLSKSQTVRLSSYERREFTLRLQEDLGLVNIRTTPGADILVDGKKVGTGSAKLQLLAIPHKIELRKKDYRTIRKTVTPSNKRPLVIREELIGETAARLAESPRNYTNSVGIRLRLFQPSAYTMGAPRSQKGQRANEFQRKVQLRKAFYAALHEVTNSQYVRFRKGTGGSSSAPVTGVTWIDAANFSNWLSQREKLTPFYRISGGRLAGVSTTSDGYRLLTESEWEWLARVAGRKKQTTFTWGDSSTVPAKSGNIADENANGLVRYYVPRYNDGFVRTAPVGSFPAEMSGLFDLTGNVSEWVHDFYSLDPPDKGQVDIDPLGPSVGDTHVFKGSSWKSGTRTKLRAAYREGRAKSRDDIGFRIGRYLHAAQ